MHTAQGSETHRGFDSRMRSRRRCRSVHPRYPHSLNSLHDVLAFVKLHQYFNNMSDDRRVPGPRGGQGYAPRISARAHARARQGGLEAVSEGRRPFKAVTAGCMNPFTAFPAVAGYRDLLVTAFLLLESEQGLLRLDVPARPSCLVWCDTNVVLPLVARARASPLGPAPSTISTALHLPTAPAVRCVLSCRVAASGSPSTHLLLGPERVEGGFQNTPPSTRSIICGDYREYLRHRASTLDHCAGYSLALRS
ncbi:hypothetical protein B0H13DRAFT_2680386 [Mycena leptocephala]|nr:hypothetical protein B0H13DRAFT_2680386 [Mycena leptocephala]